MKQGINLTSGRKRVDNAFRKAQTASIIFFVLSVVISLSLIAYRLVLKGTYESLDQKEQALNSQLLQLQEKKDKFVETKSRIAEIKKVIGKRNPMTVRVQYISSIIPEDSTVNTINGSDDEIQITLESDNLVALNELLEQKIRGLATDRKREIKKIELKSFGLNPRTLQYSVSYAVTFG